VLAGDDRPFWYDGPRRKPHAVIDVAVGSNDALGADSHVIPYNAPVVDDGSWSDRDSITDFDIDAQSAGDADFGVLSKTASWTNFDKCPIVVFSPIVIRSAQISPDVKTMFEPRVTLFAT